MEIEQSVQPVNSAGKGTSALMLGEEVPSSPPEKPADQRQDLDEAISKAGDDTKTPSIAGEISVLDEENDRVDTLPDLKELSKAYEQCQKTQ
ncbi:hypothetical protein G7Y89_g1626 [Cudoniella acicularis]|uniref:Uncharacterized protein n=1 Tax=Cudoniella acicularis TaxID=354080 RepID=A0A8H4W789_9HELO|nr:hypothetical protein G7Y89_g1626 [Cudoniella acicularis]